MPRTPERLRSRGLRFPEYIVLFNFGVGVLEFLLFQCQVGMKYHSMNLAADVQWSCDSLLSGPVISPLLGMMDIEECSAVY